jgi:hypothetical protein
MCNQKRLGLFERGYRSLATDRRKIDEETVQGLSYFEVVQKSLKRNASLPENWNPPSTFWSLMMTLSII